MSTPEQLARQNIDDLLDKCGWIAQSRAEMNLGAGRGTRVINPTDLLAVTPDAARKTHFVIVDAVGVVEQRSRRRRWSANTRCPLRNCWKRSRIVGADTRVGPMGDEGEHVGSPQRWSLPQRWGSPRQLANALLDAIDPDKPIEMVEAGSAPSVEAARAELIDRAVRPFDDPKLRKALIDIQALNEQTIDRVRRDRIIGAGFSAADTDRARATIESFRQFIEQHRDEIAALEQFGEIAEDVA